MDLELDPPQPDPIAAAIARLLAHGDAPVPDPWWRAGIEESLEEE